MREPEWVYRQRRQRAAVAVAMVIGAIAMLVTFGPALGGGFDLDGRSPTPLDRPDPDEILAREQRQLEAEKQRRAERREERAERRARPKRPRRAPKPRAARPEQGDRPAGTAPTPTPSPAPAGPDPATAPAPPPPQPAPPQPANGGAVDPRFY
jgi:hypothetical protein